MEITKDVAAGRIARRYEDYPGGRNCCSEIIYRGIAIWGDLMESYYLFLIFLVLFIAMLVGISLLTSRRQKSVTDFWLAGRELGAGIIGLSTAASWINASALLLATGMFLLIGVGSIWLWVFPNIAALIIIAAISGRIKNIPALTQPELMEIRYDPLIRAPVALAVTVMMVLFSVSDFIGFKLVLGSFYGIEPIYAILIMAAAAALICQHRRLSCRRLGGCAEICIAGGAGSVCGSNGSMASGPKRSYPLRQRPLLSARIGGIPSSWEGYWVHWCFSWPFCRDGWQSRIPGRRSGPLETKNQPRGVLSWEPGLWR